MKGILKTLWVGSIMMTILLGGGTGNCAEDTVIVYDPSWSPELRLERQEDGSWKAYDANTFELKGYVTAGRIYDQNWKLQGYYDQKSGRTYSPTWEPKLRFKDGKIYGNKWRLRGYTGKGK